MPDYLIIHLKRFYFQGPWREKIERPVAFPPRCGDGFKHTRPWVRWVTVLTSVVVPLLLLLRDLNLSSIVRGPDTGAPPRYDLFAVTVRDACPTTAPGQAFLS